MVTARLKKGTERALLFAVPSQRIEGHIKDHKRLTCEGIVYDIIDYVAVFPGDLPNAFLTYLAHGTHIDSKTMFKAYPKSDRMIYFLVKPQVKNKRKNGKKRKQK